MKKSSLFRLLLLSSLASGLASAPSARAEDTVAEDLLGNLATMRSVYRAVYAPAEWKRKYTGYDLEQEYRKAVAAVAANPNLTLPEARAILKDFIYAMKDYH